MSLRKNGLSLSAAAILLGTSMVALTPTASAAESVDDRINACVSALDAGGKIKAADYRARFKGERGGRLKQLTILLLPVADGASKLSATCKIKKGEVVEYSLNS